jgi:hypothetical protein
MNWASAVWALVCLLVALPATIGELAIYGHNAGFVW